MTAIKSTSTSEPNPPFRETCREQYLFLLEFYVRHIQSPRLVKLNEMFFVPTTVAFRFLDFKTDEDLQLNPVDCLFQPRVGIVDVCETFDTGRSVLFALSQDVVSDVYRDFRIDLCVCKKMPAEIRPDVLVGRAELDLSVHFAALRKEMIDCARYPGADLPIPSKSFDDDVPLVFDTQSAGSINVFARLSGYGQTIVTEFTSPDQDSPSTSSFLFKAAEPAACRDEPTGFKCRVLDPDSLSVASSENGTGGRRDCLACKPPKMPCAPCRVASGARIRREGSGEVGCGRGQGGMAGKGEPERSCVLESCGPIQTSRGPKEPCGKAVVLKVSGLIDACNDGEPRNPCVTVVPESEATDPAKLRDDPDHDVFILRIGKKGLVNAGEKSDIQLEMRTPKGPERRPPVRLETREMQTEEGTPGAGKKAGKGKKKK